VLIAVAATGVLICLGSLAGIVAPAGLIGVIHSVMQRPGVLFFAVTVRLALGVLLLLTAPSSLFPLGFRVIGAIAICAALVLPMVGRARILQLMEWFAGLPAWTIRAWLVFGFAFGGFLIYGTGLV